MKEIISKLKVGDICPGFKKGNDGFCKHYTGSRKNKENCTVKCKKHSKLVYCVRKENYINENMVKSNL